LTLKKLMLVISRTYNKFLNNYVFTKLDFSIKKFSNVTCNLLSTYISEKEKYYSLNSNQRWVIPSFGTFLYYFTSSSNDLITMQIWCVAYMQILMNPRAGASNTTSANEPCLESIPRFSL